MQNAKQLDLDQKQDKLDRRYVRMALIWAENSYCVRRQVGALIVKDKNDYIRWIQWNAFRF